MCVRSTLGCVAPHSHAHALVPPRAPHHNHAMAHRWKRARDGRRRACTCAWGVVCVRCVPHTKVPTPHSPTPSTHAALTFSSRALGAREVGPWHACSRESVSLASGARVLGRAYLSLGGCSMCGGVVTLPASPWTRAFESEHDTHITMTAVSRGSRACAWR